MQRRKSWVCMALLSVSVLVSQVTYAKKIAPPPMTGSQTETVGAALVLSAAQLAERDRMAGRRDELLVGKWVGDAPAQESCSAYAWRTERAADGTYRLHYFDEAQTLLDDQGFWWVDREGRYHEYSTDTQEEAVIYTYRVEDQQVMFRNVNPVVTNGCEVTEFAEKKIS